MRRPCAFIKQFTIRNWKNCKGYKVLTYIMNLFHVLFLTEEENGLGLRARDKNQG